VKSTAGRRIAAPEIVTNQAGLSYISVVGEVLQKWVTSPTLGATAI
jgi:hypothetical protein